MTTKINFLWGFFIFIFFSLCTYNFSYSVLTYFRGAYVDIKILKIDKKKVSQNHINYYAKVTFEYKNKQIIDVIQINQDEFDKKSINRYFHDEFGYAEPDSKLATIFVFCIVAFLSLIFLFILFFSLKRLFYVFPAVQRCSLSN